MRTITTIAILFALAPTAAWAQASCGQLQIVNTVQLARDGNMDFVPVHINGTQKNFLLDTGGSLTVVSQNAATDLKLPIREGNTRMFDITGRVSAGQTLVDQYIVGHMLGKSVQMQVMSLPFDGIFGLDGWSAVDLDVDFGTDKLNMFSPNHCAGRIQYWPAPVLASVPMKYVDQALTIRVMLDGHEELAQIDTGASYTTLTIDEAKRNFGIEPGSADTPEKGTLNGDESLKIYQHQFKTLSFGEGATVTVNNADVRLIPNVVGRNMSKVPLQGSRVKTEKDFMTNPDMLIGMNVLRKLHLYIAFGEAKVYITDASGAPAPAAAPAGPAPAQ